MANLLGIPLPQASVHRRATAGMNDVKTSSILQQNWTGLGRCGRVLRKCSNIQCWIMHFKHLLTFNKPKKKKKRFIAGGWWWVLHSIPTILNQSTVPRKVVTLRICHWTLWASCEIWKCEKYENTNSLKFKSKSCLTPQTPWTRYIPYSCNYTPCRVSFTVVMESFRVISE